MLKHLRFLPLAALVFTACGRGQEADGAEDGDESATVTSAESALTAELSDEVAQPVSATGEALAQAAAARVPTRMTPSGCVVATQMGATVTYVLTNCTGPWGLVKVSGTLTVVYSRGMGGAVQAVVTGNGIKANNATFDVNATVNATQAAGVKRAQVTSQSTGTGPRGASLERQGSYTVTWDEASGCLTLDGVWETKVALRSWTTTVTAFKKCAGACPAAGGSIVVEAARLTVTLTYDGSSTAAWTANNRSGTVKLLCGG
ncbi:MAG: hypothetical protein AB1938_06460 [Myxococcota bacterium]